MACTCMTPEEEAVIKTAERWHDNGGHYSGSGVELLLHESVTALRDSRKPKPRWGARIYNGALHYLTFDGSDLSISSDIPGAIEAIAEALNRASERGEP